MNEALDTCEQLAKHFEGLADVRGDKVYPYLDPVAIPTQGRGHRVPSLKNPPWSMEHADEVFAQDCQRYVRIAKQLCPGLTGRALGAIGDFAYNLGPTRLAASTLRKRLNEGDMQGAREEIVKWVHAGGRVLPGLVKRRRMEARCLR